MTTELAKQRAAVAAVAEIESGMLVGLGTGTTAAFAISELGRRIRAERLDVRAVGTSLATEANAHAAGIPMLDFADVARVDLCIDGADEIDPQFRAIKGGGGAMLREKIVASAARRMICIVDAGKRVDQLGTDHPLPIEVLPFARDFVSQAIRDLGGTPVLRRAKNGQAVLSDQDNLLIDCRFAALDDPAALAGKLSIIPGLLGHGLFLDEIDALIVGDDAGVQRVERSR
jgi:ribose 5-phosphate isomerase A